MHRPQQSRDHLRLFFNVKQQMYAGKVRTSIKTRSSIIERSPADVFVISVRMNIGTVPRFLWKPFLQHVSNFEKPFSFREKKSQSFKTPRGLRQPVRSTGLRESRLKKYSL